MKLSPAPGNKRSTFDKVAAVLGLAIGLSGCANIEARKASDPSEVSDFQGRKEVETESGRDEVRVITNWNEEREGDLRKPKKFDPKEGVEAPLRKPKAGRREGESNDAPLRDIRDSKAPTVEAEDLRAIDFDRPSQPKLDQNLQIKE